MLQGLAGIAALLALAWVLSEDRARIPWRTVIGGVLLQAALALLLIGFPPATRAILLLNDAADALQRATDAGTSFVFGYLAGPPLPFVETHPGASFILAFKALPLVLVISALASLLFHWGVLQQVMRGFAWLLRRWLGVGGALALGAAVHVFVGMIEAPLLVRPWLARMQRGEIFALMTCGMAGIAGTVMVIYAAILGPVIPNALGNILIASVISTPAALAIAALMVPFGPGEQAARLALPHAPVSALDAVVKGTADGIPVLVGIVAVLLVTVALVTLLNMMLAVLPFDHALTLQRIFAWPFQVVMWLIGIPWSEAPDAAALMATKTVLNEFVAYLHLAALPPETLSPRSRLIMTYAMCGFANFGSLGILVGGLGAMVPERRQEIVALGFRSILAGTLATCTSGAVAGMLG
ncbi:NupC/NupG family nucleoside CNT transporter [Limobrevibacterium gyesilva]|uniref:Nucleoside:proton symporter n=1 Tax=Limobrevibacterium gyesilva TaxID=2991712 RepID=A0AA41YNI0_9PROT|nr:nucleoside transporter C-terminal domain-containing protein [Limobrevibacterium gyesilva]MCW3476784.1 nucleoside:proton symporter [Limobrevibacterium gyesilva]